MFSCLWCIFTEPSVWEKIFNIIDSYLGIMYVDIFKEKIFFPYYFLKTSSIFQKLVGKKPK